MTSVKDRVMLEKSVKASLTTSLARRPSHLSPPIAFKTLLFLSVGGIDTELTASHMLDRKVSRRM